MNGAEPRRTPPCDDDAEIPVKDLGRIACARCRRLKIKCTVADDSSKCSRCLTSQSECLEAPSTRKLTKRKDSDRVSHLESTVSDLQSTIQQMRQQRALPSPPSPYRAPDIPSIRSFDSPVLRSTISSNTTPSTWSSYRPASDMAPEVDTTGLDELISSNILTQADLINLYERIKPMLRSGLRLSPNLSYWELYRTRPILLQALITIASSSDSLLHPVLVERMKNRLLFEYFVNNTRRIDLVQAFLLNCEYQTFSDAPMSSPMSSSIHSYAPLATEVALDLNMFEDPEKDHSRIPALDELEYERTLLWLFTVHTAMLSAMNRQPQRVQWTAYHTVCKIRLEAADPFNRELALITAIPRLQIEIQECGTYITSPDVLKTFIDRIRSLEKSCEPSMSEWLF